jgi:hypothetical protein
MRFKESYINIGKKIYEWTDIIDTNNRGNDLINADVFSGFASPTLSNVGQGLQYNFYSLFAFYHLFFSCYH